MGFQGTGAPTLRTIQQKATPSVSAPGLLFEEAINGINSVRLSVSGADPLNVVLLEGTVNGSGDWETLGTISGNDATLFNTQAFDKIRATTTTYGGVPFNFAWKQEDHPSAYSIIDKDNDYLAVNPDGSINVNAVIVNDVPTGTQEYKNLFGQATAVLAGIQTTIVSYTVPGLASFSLYLGEFSGTNIATYDLYIDNVLQARKRTWFNGNMADEFNFEPATKEGFIVEGGTIIRIDVTHNRPFSGDFEARIFGLLITPI